MSSGTLESERESDPGMGSGDENENEDGEDDEDDEEVINRPRRRAPEPLPFSARQVDYVFTGPNRMTAVPRKKVKRAGVPGRKGSFAQVHSFLHI